MLPPPTLDATQRQDGYNKSLALRQARAELKKELKAGNLRLSEVVRYDWVKGMKVYDLLRALPGVGGRKAAKLLEKCVIHQANTVARCSEKQLERLVSVVERRSANALSEIEKKSGPHEIS